MLHPDPPPPTVLLAGVPYTTTAPDRALAAVLHGPGPFASVAYDGATNTWTLGGHTAAILAALERCGIVLDGAGDTQTDETTGGIFAPVPPPAPPVQTPAQRAAEIRALQGTLGPARRALQRCDERLSRALRADRPFDRAAATRDSATALTAVTALARLLEVP